MKYTFGRGTSARSIPAWQTVWLLPTGLLHLHGLNLGHRVAFLQTVMSAVLILNWLLNPDSSAVSPSLTLATYVFVQ